MEKIPQWLIDAMQGVTFWIGHRRTIFRHYPLSESALVTEACNLIQANISENYYLFPEQTYKKLSKAPLPPILDKQKRADLAIYYSEEKNTKKDVDNLRYVFEVKRANTTKKSRIKDIKRLACLLEDKRNSNIRCFLIVISEHDMPEDYVTLEGNARTTKHFIDCGNTKTAYYSVRRVLKASAGFRNKKSGHYACIIEVFND